MPPFWEVGSSSKIVIPCHGGERTCIYLLSSFLLFRTKYARYLMAFGVCFFMRVLILYLG